MAPPLGCDGGYYRDVRETGDAGSEVKVTKKGRFVYEIRECMCSWNLADTLERRLGFCSVILKGYAPENKVKLTPLNATYD